MSKATFKISFFSGVMTIQDGVEAVPKIPFVKKEKIKSVTLPPSITTIDENTFANCYNLENISMNDGLTSIGKQAFASCTKLKQVRIPQSVEFVGESPFYNCRNLKKIFVSKNSTLDKSSLIGKTNAIVEEY